MRVCVTGHRPDKLGGYGPPQENRTGAFVWHVGRRELQRLKHKYPNLTLLNGMALGVDQWYAQLAVELDIPFEAYIPFVGQEKSWPIQSQRVYQELLAKARCITNTSGLNHYRPEYMHHRNETMVQQADYGLAVWNGDLSGGTYDCFRRILLKGIPYTHIYSKTIAIKRSLGGVRVLLPDNPLLETDERGRAIIRLEGPWQGAFLEDVVEQDPNYVLLVLMQNLHFGPVYETLRWALNANRP